MVRVGKNAKSQLRRMATPVLRPFSRWYYINRYLPASVRIESTTLCQLRCTGCSFQAGGNDNLGRGCLAFEDFRRFVEMNPFVQKVELSNYGEAFLNPNLVDIMRFAHEKGIQLSLRNGSNFNTVSEEQMRAMVETGFRRIVLSVDGASQETYSKYRVGGDFDAVISNIKRLQELKEEAGSEFPELKWQFVLNEHNELEVGKAKELAKELGIPIGFKLNWDPSYAPTHREYLQQETGLVELTEAEYLSAHGAHRFGGLCKQVFLEPQINWDGRLLGCCTRHYATFDVNVFEVGLAAALRSPKYLEAKRCLLTVHPDSRQFGGCMCFDCEKRTAREQSGVALELPLRVK